MAKIQLLTLARSKSISPEDFEKKLWELSTGQERSARRYTGTSSEPIRVFRSRPFTADALPTEATEYSYPNPLICKSGRANVENVPVFYASAGGPTTFVESRCAAGNIVVVSEFRCYAEMVVQEIGLAGNDQAATEYEIIMNSSRTATPTG